MSNPLMRRLGKTEVKVSAVGMGCWAIGGLLGMDKYAIGWGKIDDEKSMEAIQKALDLNRHPFAVDIILRDAGCHEIMRIHPVLHPLHV